MPNFDAYPLWANLAIFVAAAALVWAAGTRLARHASRIADRTGIGAAVVGIVLLGGITSLPEAAVSVSAAVAGNGEMAVNNLLGGVAMQVAIIALADAVHGREAISSITARPVVLLQAAFAVFLLCLVSLAIVVGELNLGFVGGWSTAILIGYAASIHLIRSYQARPTWIAAEQRAGGGVPDDPRPHVPDALRADVPDDSGSLRPVYVRVALAATVILVAGVALSGTGAALAVQTGLGHSFVGAVLLAISTSLPEVSTALSAVRLHRYDLAFSDVFGTNLIDLALIFVVDAVQSGPPVLGLLGDFSLVAALLGILLTMIYIAGLIERRDRTIFRMGYDSAAVIVVYVGGLCLLYLLR